MANTYLTKTFSGSPTSRTTMTISAWVKRSALGGTTFSAIGTDGNYEAPITFSSDAIRITSPYMSAQQGIYVTNALYRDVSAWYHIVTQYDTTNATASDRMKLYVNGERITSFSSQTNSNQNNTTTKFLVAGQTTFIGLSGGSGYFDGCIANVHVIDGQALTPSSFGATDTATGIWKPKSYTGSYGANGFFLKFENPNSLGTDSSGNGHNFTVAGGTPTQTIDTPSNVFCTFNAVAAPYSAPTLSNGNTTTTNNSADYDAAFGTFAVSKGKWYWELKKTDIAAGYNDGVFDVDANSFSVLNPMNVSTGYTGFYNFGVGQMRKDNATSGSYGTFANGDIMGIALDMDNKLISIYKNGTIHVSNFALSTGCNLVVPTAIYYQTGSSQYNFGNGFFGTTTVSSAENPDDGIGIFEYPVPAGYKALCTKSINATEYN